MIYTVVSRIYDPYFATLVLVEHGGWGGLYAGSDILYRKYTPLLVPCLDIDVGTLYYRPIEAGSTPVCLCFSRPPEPRLPFGQDRLTTA